MTDKKYEIITYNGDPEARQYPNGQIRNKYGNVIGLLPEKARAMNSQRKNIGPHLAGEGLRKGMGTETAEEAIVELYAHATEIAKRSTGLRDLPPMIRLLAEATGFLSTAKEVNIQGRVNHVPQLPPEYFEAMERVPKDAIEAEFRDE
jgi:hypothetical protein